MCLLTIDPGTGVTTGEVVENGLPPAATRRLAEIESRARDVNRFADLAASGRIAAGLSAATEGDLDRSLRHRELRGPAGLGDELRATLGGDGRPWGALTLLRRRGDPDFGPREERLVATLAGALTEGLRGAVLREAVPAGAPPGTGVVLLDGDGAVTEADADGTAWLAELRTPGLPGDAAPAAVVSVAAAARAGAPASARIRTPAGHWLSARAGALGHGPGARVAVVLQPARAEDLAPLAADAHGLTPAERRVAELVAEGLPTDAIAESLHLSPWTVQDHLRSAFAKTGVTSRGALVARLFMAAGPARLTDPPVSSRGCA